MANTRYIQIFRRRREGKTDYRKRRGMIVGRSPFLSVRISGRYIYAQILKPSATGDLTVCAASSRDIAKKFGWKGSAKNLPSAYLTGLYLGKLASEKKVKNVVLYSGVNRFVHGSRIASVVNGTADAGVGIQVDEESLPDDKRVSGAHIADYAKKLEQSDSEKYAKVFSKLIASGLKPSEYPIHFQQVKSAITGNTKAEDEEEEDEE